MLVGLEVVVGSVPEIEGAGWIREDSTWKGYAAAEAKSIEASTYTKVRTKVRWKFGL